MATDPENRDFAPGNILVASLTNSARAAVPVALAGLQITHIVISGGAANEIVIFRDIDDSPERMRVSVLAGDTKVIPGYSADDQGTEILTASAAGDVTVTFFTVSATRTVIA